MRRRREDVDSERTARYMQHDYDDRLIVSHSQESHNTWRVYLKNTTGMHIYAYDSDYRTQQARETLSARSIESNEKLCMAKGVSVTRVATLSWKWNDL